MNGLSAFHLWGMGTANCWGAWPGGEGGRGEERGLGWRIYKEYCKLRFLIELQCRKISGPSRDIEQATWLGRTHLHASHNVSKRNTSRHPETCNRTHRDIKAAEMRIVTLTGLCNIFGGAHLPIFLRLR